MRFFQSITNNGDRILFCSVVNILKVREYQSCREGAQHKAPSNWQINFALVFSGKKYKPVILEILPGSVRGASLFELSKIYVIADGARRSVAEISDRIQNISDAFGLKLYHKIVRS